jgi:hypothetical protein
MFSTRKDINGNASALLPPAFGLQSIHLNDTNLIELSFLAQYAKKFVPESCTKYRSEALQAAVDSWCKIQVVIQQASVASVFSGLRTFYLSIQP